MSDDPLKREIEEALAVEPSPQFAVRVRQHLADEKAKRPVRHPWKLWTPVLAMAAVVAAVLVNRPAPVAPQQPEIAPETAWVQPQVPEVSDSTPSIRPAPKSVSKTPAPRRAAPVEPEVLIDPREAAAFRRFVEGIEQRSMDPVMLEALFEAAERSRSAAIEPMPVAGLEPIVIPPVSVPDKEGGNL